MNLSFAYSPLLIVLGFVLLVWLISVLVRIFVLPFLGINWPSSRVRFPWRFSILAGMVLVAMAAAVFGWLREFPVAAAAGFGLVLLLWLVVVRFSGFRQMLADRRNKELAAAIEEQKKLSAGDTNR